MSASMPWRPALRAVLAAVAAVVAIHLILILPNHPRALTPGALRMIPLELPLILVVLVLAAGAWRRPVRLLATGFLGLMALVKAADLAAEIAYGRGFNPVLDAHLAHAAWMLASGTLGLPMAAAAASGLIAAIVGIVLIAWWSTGRVQRIAAPPRLRAPLAGAGLIALALVAVDLAPGRSPIDPPGSAFTTRLAGAHVAAAWRTRADLARFRTEAAEDGLAALPPAALMPRLQGADVLILFVESYGRATLDNPRYASRIRGRLEGIGGALDEAGLVARSGFLKSPVAGGQSWLAHASLLSGLWIDNQRRYEALLASPRRTLHHLAQRAGWRTVAVMPAITLAWPEAEYFGYDQIYAAADLGYAGPPYNWVTMPDQYTLRQFERTELEAGGRDPVFAEVALISSHAPWTPIPPLIPWDEVGDGSVFARWVDAGDPPEVVWRDSDRVRAQFLEAVDYTLAVVGEFVQRRAGRPTLVVVLGDHQPAGFVAETGANRDVPVHVIGPPDLVAATAGWGWSEGMVPAAAAPVWDMDAFRDRFVAAFAAAGCVGRDGKPLPQTAEC